MRHILASYLRIAHWHAKTKLNIMGKVIMHNRSAKTHKNTINISVLLGLGRCVEEGCLRELVEGVDNILVTGDDDALANGLGVAAV